MRLRATTAFIASIALLVPASASGRFLEAAGGSEVAGAAGVLYDYRVFVDSSLPWWPTEVAAAVERALQDPRSWTASGRVRFQRVSGEPASTSIYIATPSQVGVLCLPIEMSGYNSCRQGDVLALNSDRWRFGVPHWPRVTAYRRYLVNHEMGHRIGLSHRPCPAPGLPNPVMARQTSVDNECTNGAWPTVPELLAVGAPE
jgi:hypothetical protein